MEIWCSLIDLLTKKHVFSSKIKKKKIKIAFSFFFIGFFFNEETPFLFSLLWWLILYKYVDGESRGERTF